MLIKGQNSRMEDMRELADYRDKAVSMVEKLRAQLDDAHVPLRDALASHGAMLMTDPPQDPWKTRRIAERIGAHLYASAEPEV